MAEASIKNDLPMSMTMAAFAGISWYIGIEINLSLFWRFKRRNGLYFWSCALCSWGVVLQPLCIILADFDVWPDPTGSITMIYLTWMIMVVPQSWVLYSRLHLITWTMALLVFNSVVFSVPTIVLGILAQVTSTNGGHPSLSDVNAIWAPLSATVFFTQETFLNILYIWQTHKLLQHTFILRSPFPNELTSIQAVAGRKQLLHQLIYTNLLVIALDITLLGIRYAGFFYLQGAFKPCVYGVKLKVEYVVLNRLVKSLQARNQHVSSNAEAGATSSRRSGKMSWWSRAAKGPGHRLGEAPVATEGFHLDALSGNELYARRISSQGSQVPIVDNREQAVRHSSTHGADW